MLGPAAKAFAQSRSIEQFRTWLQEDRPSALTWLKQLKQQAGAVPDVTDAFTTSEDSKVVAAFSALDAQSIAALQQARATTLGWTTGAADLPPRPPALTGTVAIVDGWPVLETPFGSFWVMNSDAFNLRTWPAEADALNYYQSGRDVAAFAGRTITVRGWPEAGWKADANGRARLLVEEFAPGASPDFVSGRVRVVGDDVFIVQRPAVEGKPARQVKLTDPTLAAALKPWDKLGVILPGAPREDAAPAVYEHTPADFYLAAGFRMATSFTPTPDGFVELTLEMAHGKTVQSRLSKAAFDGGPPRAQRQFFFGHFEDGRVVAKGYTPDSGGPFMEPDPVTAAPSLDFVKHTTPLEPVVFTPEQQRFGL